MAQPVEPVKDVNRRTLLLDLTSPATVNMSDIARATPCSLSYVSACAHGRKRPSRRLQQAAERLLGRPAEELFSAPGGGAA